MRATVLAPFGIDVEDFQISSVDAATIDAVVLLIARHRVAVFRDQDAGDAAFVRFLRLAGELTFTEGETPVDGAPELNVISNVGRTTPPRSVFHTDTSYVDRPPSLTGLRAVRLPAQSGHTQFTDQVRAARTLSARVARALAGRTVRHGVSAGASVRHPLFRRHPLTDEISLFLSTPERCTELSGVDAATSARTIAALYRHSARPEFVYEHAWRDRDIVVWDDRTTMHRADHAGVVGDRILHRGLVLGEVPIPA